MNIAKAKELLAAQQGDRYVFGRGTRSQAASLAARCGRESLLVCNARHTGHAAAFAGYLQEDGIVPGAGANTPRQDVYRIAAQIRRRKPDSVIALGGGSTIDACKAALALAALDGEFAAGTSDGLEPLFGTGAVTAALARAGKRTLPLMAMQTAAGSAAHLTKYANVSDPEAGQKKLIVDDALIPARALFDYELSASVPPEVTVDGALDGIAHCFEVLMGAKEEIYPLAASLAETAIALVLEYAPRALARGGDMEAREALGLATDLGGCAIMIGGTNGAHLTSFSLVDLTSHGRACGIMNPYYAVFFAPKIEGQLRLVGGIFKHYGYIQENLDGLEGRDLGVPVAQGMIAFGKSLGVPPNLASLPGFSQKHIDRALAAAKNPQLEMKLKNMPIPLTAASVDEYLGPVLQAAAIGDFSLICLRPVAGI